MFKWVRRILAKPSTPQSWFRRRNAGDADGSDGPLNLRRWGAAETNRLNQAHWQGAISGRTINLDLVAHLETLRTRSAYEAANNSDVEGVINTHVCDVVGDIGPTLQVQSDSPAYNEDLENVWGDWWAMPDLNGETAGVELLDLWIRSGWLNGEYLVQIINDDDAPGPVKARLYNLCPRRLATPPGETGSPDVILGVRRHKTGRPLSYCISGEPESQFAGAELDTHSEIPAAEIIHGFRRIEAGQVRGVPWMATGLPVVADLRDFDDQVLDAARAAADSGTLLHTNHPDAEYLEVNESTEVPRRTISTCPPGWTPMQMVPQQPSAQYLDFHDEKLRQVGHPVGMPLMIIKLDSRKHNYSSARFDDRVYDRANHKLQAFLERITLNRLVDLVAREAGLGENPLPPKPARVRYEWTWPPRENVDPTKEEKAATERLNNGTSHLRKECAAKGLDWEEVVAQRAHEQEALEEAGLPPIGLSSQSSTDRKKLMELIESMKEEEEEEEEEEEKKDEG